MVMVVAPAAIRGKLLKTCFCFGRGCACRTIASALERGATRGRGRGDSLHKTRDASHHFSRSLDTSDTLILHVYTYSVLHIRITTEITNNITCRQDPIATRRLHRIHTLVYTHLSISNVLVVERIHALLPHTDLRLDKATSFYIFTRT